VISWVRNKPGIDSHGISRRQYDRGRRVRTGDGRRRAGFRGGAISPFTVALAGVAGGWRSSNGRPKAGATLWGSYKDSIINVYTTVMSYLKPIIAEAQTVIQGVKDAVTGGDLELAVTIVIERGQVDLVRGFAWLAEKTGGFLGDILGNLGAGKWKAPPTARSGCLTAAFWRGMGVLDLAWARLRNHGRQGARLRGFHC